MTLEQQKVFLEDIRYVLRQAQAYRDSVQCGYSLFLRDHKFGATIHNALLESSLAFLRKVNDFFGKSGAASVRAFLPDYPLQWLYSKKDSELLNERVMHLSLHHAQSGPLDWSDFLSTHLAEAERRFLAFEQHLAEKRPDLLA